MYLAEEEIKVIKKVALTVLVIAIMFGAVAPLIGPTPTLAACNQNGRSNYWWGYRIYMSSGTVNNLSSTERLRDAIYAMLPTAGVSVAVDWYFMNMFKSNNRGCGVYMDFSWATYWFPGAVAFARIGPQ